MAKIASEPENGYLKTNTHHKTLIKWPHVHTWGFFMRVDSAQRFEIIEDDNGYITAEGIIATAGEKLQYGNQTETITDNALFGNMDEWEGLPVTLQHPRGLLDTTNTQKHQVGSVIKVERRGDSLWAKFKVTSKNAIDAVKSGLRGLSAGYRATLDGANQVARSNNHLALCNVGRSPSSGIRRDSNDLGDSQMVAIKFPDGYRSKTGLFGCRSSASTRQALMPSLSAQTRRKKNTTNYMMKS